MKTGLYGGSFNPVHNGHLHILRAFTERLQLDRVLLVPTCSPPHKQAGDLASAAHRLAMCRLAAADNGKITVSDMEIRRGGKSFTADTLMQLALDYPEDAFYLLMGEDMFLTVEKWYRADVIISSAVLCCSPRSPDGFHRLSAFAAHLESAHNARTVVEDIPFVDISSTQIRELAAKGLPLSAYVPQAVAAYIKENHLYESGDPLADES